MSKCKAGPGCSKTCTYGCGCISNTDGSGCECYCANSSGELEMAWGHWDLDAPVRLCFEDVEITSLADGLAQAFSARIVSRTHIQQARISQDLTDVTLRSFGKTLGIEF